MPQIKQACSFTLASWVPLLVTNNYNYSYKIVSDAEIEKTCDSWPEAVRIHETNFKLAHIEI